ncbi:MAG: type II secretion system protein [Planctomycetota bacterium]
MSRASTGPVRRADRGFSLIELLVVIAVISILIGILLPALPAVIANARRTACAANLRGLGQGLELYKGDSNEVYPDARYMPEPWLTNFDGESQLGLPELPTFPEALADQIDRYSEAYRCPGDKTIATTTTSTTMAWSANLR